MSRPSTASPRPGKGHSDQTTSTKAKGLKDIRVDEEVKIAVNIALERFRYSDQKEMEFPSSLTSTERAFIHRHAQSFGLISKSKGKGANRFLTLKKKDGSELPHTAMTCSFTQNTKQTIRSLIQRFPVTNKERIDLLPKTERGAGLTVEAENTREMNRTSGRLNNGIPQIPPRRGISEFDSFRQSLPVFDKQPEIVKTIKENRVTLIIGETGSGKTTQIPQFLLDDSNRNGIPCRIFCTQPRRLAAIAVAERVAAERGEKIGQTVGYQIRLESKISIVKGQAIRIARMTSHKEDDGQEFKGLTNMFAERGYPTELVENILQEILDQQQDHSDPPQRSSEFRFHKSTFNPPVDKHVAIFQQAVIKDLHFHFRSDYNIKHNLSISEQLALTHLKNNTDIVILSADKGGAVVVMDADYYWDEGNRQLSNHHHYMKMSTDPTPNFKREIDDFLQEAVEAGIISDKIKSHLIVKDPAKQYLYLLPKIHKSLHKPPGRPIVSGIGSLTEPLSVFLTEKLKPLLSLIRARLHDTTEFLQIVSESELEPDWLMCTLDVKSLYTSILHWAGLAALDFWLNKANIYSPGFNTLLICMAEHILTKNVFYFKQDCYWQIQGTAMGASFAPIYADLYMGYVEEHIIYDELHNIYIPEIDIWRRYLDDCWLVWKGGSDYLQEFVEHLNGNIWGTEFTVYYHHNEIHFLDVFLQRQPDNTLKTSVYRKFPEFNTLLHANSVHPKHTINNIPKSQFLWLKRICSSEQDLKQHHGDLANRFLTRGYSRHTISSAMQWSRNQSRDSLLEYKEHQKQTNQETCRFVTTYGRNTKHLLNIIDKHWNILKSHSLLEDYLGEQCSFSYRKGKTLGSHFSHKKINSRDETLSQRTLTDWIAKVSKQQDLDLMGHFQTYCDKWNASGKLHADTTGCTKEFSQFLKVSQTEIKTFTQTVIGQGSKAIGMIEGSMSKIVHLQEKYDKQLADAQHDVIVAREEIKTLRAQLETQESEAARVTELANQDLLRLQALMSPHKSSVFLILQDEVHERDRFSDFLLIKLRDVLQKHSSLKLILSSAALDVNLFMRYFSGCPITYIPGKPFEVKELFLEDILRTTNYMNKDMLKYRKEKQKEEKQQNTLSEWYKAQDSNSKLEPQRQRTVSYITEDYDLLDEGSDGVFNHLTEKDASSLEPWLIKEMDACLSDIWLQMDVEAFAQLFHLISSENVSVDYRHSETSATPLMVAAGRGFMSQVEQLISMGASVHIKASNGWTALDWARHFGQTETVDLLQSFTASLETGNLDESSLVQKSGGDLSTEDRELLKVYHHSFDDEKVDLDLIMHLLYSICYSSEEGAVLIFLPGYDEIVGLRDRILFDDKRFADNSHRFQIFMLHSNMQTSDQKKVLKTPPSGIRKIILSTNIAETSITVNDVVFVIDAGKVKEKSFDALSHVTMLKMVWISKASAIQRKGRAGRCRPGICFHLFSRLRFQNMLEFQTPELLRMPLQELCLHTKLLSPSNCTIADFLAKAPEPPPALIVRNAVQTLKTIDAMDAWEDLTELGCHLADLPVEPHLGKMVLCAVVLKCLDPILTIACTLAYRDPFVLPAQASQKRAAMLCRKRFTAGTFSDHMALLRAFQAWQKARSDGWERAFCEKNFLSQATLEIIIGMRTQLLGQLRASGFVRARGDGDIRDVNTNSENWAVVKAALVAGMYPNVIHVDRHNVMLVGSKEKKVRIHPTSVLSQPQYKKIPPANGQAAAVQALPTDWIIYDEMTRAHRISSIRCCSAVTPVTVALFSGPARLPSSALQEPSSLRVDGTPNESSDSEMEDQSTANLAVLKLDEWLNFKLDPEVSALLLQLRQKWHSLFLRRIKAPSKSWSQADEATLWAVITVMSTEEQAAGLQQPSGIGQRPKPMASEELPMTSSWKLNNSRKSSSEAEFSDDCSSMERTSVKSPSPAYHQQPQLLRYKERSILHPKRSTDDRSDQSSVKSTDSSNYPSPCASPSLPSSGKGSKSPSPRPNMPVRYFIMKSSNLRNLEISQQKSIWSTTPSNERKLNRAFTESSVVYLIFSVQGSGHFQGFARMSSEIGRERSQDWGSTGLGGVFKIEWIRRESLPFQYAHHLLNPWNDNKKVQISRDGQELEPQVGEHLLQLWMCFIYKVSCRKNCPELSDAYEGTLHIRLEVVKRLAFTSCLQA
ncbi:3'-5' RNA helicase YTHDC2 [Protopterus annectens]|uniref:3'-5' RNA helicase YTHDC2 n=1 Tax=Protopterus annectens TaxID=7888 RepID=UPI001CFB1F0E|nr:3'-5' RNA helicase YTHDC2 [Protopterus annectens]